VDEQHRALGENDGGAGRSGEAGEPGKPLLVRRQIFILMAISVGHYEAVKPPPCKFSPQGREASSGFRRLRGVVESLELGLEIFECHLVHDRILKSLSAPHNSCCRAARPGRVLPTLPKVAVRVAGRDRISVIHPSKGMRRSSTNPNAR